MVDMKYELNNIYNEDCMIALKELPNGYFDLAIIDPPYRNEEDNQPTKDMREKAVDKNMKTFGGKPTQEYFDELFRVSKNQIIWGN